MDSSLAARRGRGRLYAARAGDSSPDVSLERNQAEVGRRHEILVEGPSRKDEGMATGRTRTNKLVHVPGPLEEGELVDVTISGAAPHHLVGSLA